MLSNPNFSNNITLAAAIVAARDRMEDLAVLNEVSHGRFAAEAGAAVSEVRRLEGIALRPAVLTPAGQPPVSAEEDPEHLLWMASRGVPGMAARAGAVLAARSGVTVGPAVLTAPTASPDAIAAIDPDTGLPL